MKLELGGKSSRSWVNRLRSFMPDHGRSLQDLHVIFQSSEENTESPILAYAPHVSPFSDLMMIICP